MESIPHNEILCTLIGMVLTWIAAWLGLKLPGVKTAPKESDPARVTGAGPDEATVPPTSEDAEHVALYARAEKVADELGLDRKKVLALDPVTLATLLTMLATYGPGIVAFVKSLIETFWVKKSSK
jgi:hypothetical protein